MLLRAPLAGLLAARGRLDRLSRSLERELQRALATRREALGGLGGRLRALSPMATLERGYALVRSEGRVVTDAGDITVGDKIDVRLGRGSLVAGVETVDGSEG